MMKLAIPTWQGRISPVLDVAQRLLVVEVVTEREISRREVEIIETQLPARFRLIQELGVQVLICGALSKPLEGLLTSAGVQVMPRMCGPTEEILRAFLEARLPSEEFLMPGCCGRHRRFRRGRLGGGRQGGEW
ncbi:MAG: hypothetical protein ABIG44_05900 [Planctomycetota bacterium]